MTVTLPPPLSTLMHTRRSRLLHHWRSDLCETWNDAGALRFPALSGQTGELTRAGASAADDSSGASYAPVHSAPAWQVTSGIPGLLLGSSPAEYLEWDAAWLPQELTLYVHGIERGTAGASANDVLVQIGADGSNPHLIIESSGTVYRADYFGSASRTSTLGAAPSNGEQVELRLTLSAAGVVQIHQSIEGGAETSASAATANALPAAWGATKIRLNANQAGASLGDFEYRTVKVAAGILTLAEARVAW